MFFWRTPADFIMKSKTLSGISSPFPFRKKKIWKNGKQEIKCIKKKKKTEGQKGSDEMEAQKNYVKSWGVRRRKKRDEKKLYCQNLLSSQSVSQKGSALSGALLFDFTGCHFLSILFSSIFPFFPSLTPSLLSFSYPLSSQKNLKKSGVTGIYSTSDPLYDCGRFAFMLDGLPKRLSDKAMNTLTGFSLLVSLRLAGQWCWY